MPIRSYSRSARLSQPVHEPEPQSEPVAVYDYRQGREGLPSTYSADQPYHLQVGPSYTSEPSTQTTPVKQEDAIYKVDVSAHCTACEGKKCCRDPQTNDWMSLKQLSELRIELQRSLENSRTGVPGMEKYLEYLKNFPRNLHVQLWGNFCPKYLDQDLVYEWTIRDLMRRWKPQQSKSMSWSQRQKGYPWSLNSLVEEMIGDGIASVHTWQMKGNEGSGAIFVNQPLPYA